jgi:hypothetical protein
MAAPRIFGISASAAPVVAILRRGPSDWFHVGRWDLDRGEYEPGAWVRGTIYPQRCDVSLDGRWLCYFMLRGGAADWDAGSTYVAISKLPWVHALAAWGSAGTWTRGAHFVDGDRAPTIEAPDEGAVDMSKLRYGLAVTLPASFAVERRRGWDEAPGNPPRVADDIWDERRADRVVMRKPRPGDIGPSPLQLQVKGRYAAFRQGPFNNELRDARYSTSRGSDVWPLDDVQWADWDATGRLVVATNAGHLQVRTVDGNTGSVLDEVDLSDLAPDPQPAPPEARRW